MKKFASILDYSYPFLDPAVWDHDRKLFAYQKDFVLRLIDKMNETYNLKQPEIWIEDIVILGSLTTSKWLLTSDMDVHIRVNLDAFIASNMPGSTKEQAFEKLDLTRKEFDRAKILAPMTQHPIEFYFESIEFKPSNIALVGVYSLKQDLWLKEPIIFDADLDFEESKKDVIAQAEALAEELDGSLGKIQRDIQRVSELEEVIKAWGPDKQQLFYAKVEAKLKAIEAEILKDLQIKQELVDARHSNQDAMSEIEVKFKWLARFGFFGILSNLKTLLEQTGGEVTTQELPLIEKIISEGTIKEAGSVLDINGTKFYKNPSKNQIYSLLKKLEYPHIRFIIDPMTRDLYAFSGYSFTHTEGMRALGIPPTGFNYQNFTGDIKDLGDIDFAFEQRNKKVAFIKQAGQVMRFQDMGGNEIRVVKDPTPEQAVNLFNNSHSKQLRYILDDSGLYIWDAYFAEHVEIGEELGLDSSSINRMGFINSERDALKWTGALNQTASIKEAFLKEAFEKETDNQIAIDFDGTIAKDKKFPDIGEPEEGVKEALSKIKDLGYDILIYTCRSKDKEELEVVHEYLDKHEIPYDSIFEGEKPFAKFYIDDRAIHFDSWDNVLKTVEKSEKKASSSILKIEPYGGGVEFPVIINPSRQQVANLLPQCEFGELRVIQGNNTYVWDASKATHEHVLEYLAGQGLEEYSNAQTGYVLDPTDVDKFSWKKAASLAIVAALGTKYWLDPSGKEFPVGTALGHYGWIRKNYALLEEVYGIKFLSPTSQLDEGDELIANGWTRITTESDYDFSMEVADINNLPPYLDNFVAQHYTGGGVDIDDLQGNYQDLSDPFPSLQKAIYQAKRLRNAASLFSKKALGSPSAWIMDPNGKLYPAINNDHQETIDALAKKGIKFSFSNGWSTVRVIGNNVAFAVGKLNAIPNAVQNYLDEHNFNNVEIIPEDANLEGLAQPPTVKHKDITFGRLQKEVNRNIMMQRHMKDNTASNRHTSFSKRDIIIIASYPVLLDTSGIQQFLIDNASNAFGRIDFAQVKEMVPSGGEWILQDVPLSTFPDWTDFKGMKIKKRNTLPIVTLGPDFDWEVLDGKHRIAVANALGEKTIQAYVFKDLQKNVITAKTKKIKQGDYSCLMALVPHDLAQEIVEWGVRNVPDEDLYLDEDGKLGRELESHITIKYGLLTNNAKHVRRSFNDDKPFHAKLGKVRHFQPPELPFDVLTVEVISEDLQKANKKVCDSFECAEGLVSDEYKPHITIAYVKRDKAHEYVGFEGFDGKKVELDTVIFSPHKGNRTYFSISNDKESSFILEQINKIAGRDIGYWIDPNGEVYDVHASGLIHNEWVVANLEMLHDKYGLRIPIELYNERLEYYKNIEIDDDNVDMPVADEVWTQMIQSGWVRIGDADEGIGVEINDLQRIPPFVDSVLDPFIYDGDFIRVEDINHKYVEVEYPFKDLQSAVNKALSGQPKTASGNNFLPSLFNDTNNEWQFEYGGDDQEIDVNPDPISDETTWYAPCTEGKPRTKEVWRQFLSMFQNPFSKKEEMTINSAQEDLVNIGNITFKGKKNHTVKIEVPQDLLDQYFAIAIDMKKVLKDPKLSNSSYWDKIDRTRANLHDQLVEFAFNNLFEDKNWKDFPAISGDIRYEISDFIESMIPRDDLPKEATYDPELEQKEKDALGEDETLLEYSKGFYDPKKHDFPHNTTWDSLTQDGEPSKPTSVTYSPQISNEDNLDQNSPGGFPRRFMGKPKGEWFSDEGEVVPALQNMWKYRNSALDNMTIDITAITRQYALYVGGRLAIRTLTRQKALKICQERFPEFFAQGNYEVKEEAYTVSKQADYSNAYWIDPNGKVFQVRGSTVTTEDMNKDFNSHSDWISTNIDMLVRDYGFKPVEKSTGLFNVPLTVDDLIDAGWIRVGDAFGKDWGITLKDLNHIPSSIDSLLAQFAPEGAIITVATPNNYGANYTFEWPVKSIQNTVNQIKNRREYYQKPVMAKQASIEEINGLPVLVNPSEQELIGFSRNLKSGRMFRGLLDPHTGDLYVWDAYEAVHTYVIQKLGLDVRYSDDSPFCLYFNPSPLSISEMLERQQEVRQGKIPRSSSLKQAGDQSASVPDYLINEWKTEQINNDTDEEPYVNHDQRDYPYGMHDSPENTGYNIGWAKDNQPYVVRLDILENPAYRSDPFGIGEYNVTWYESLPTSDGIEATNPE